MSDGRNCQGKCLDSIMHYLLARYMGSVCMDDELTSDAIMCRM